MWNMDITGFQLQHRPQTQNLRLSLYIHTGLCEHIEKEPSWSVMFTTRSTRVTLISFNYIILSYSYLHKSVQLLSYQLISSNAIEPLSFVKSALISICIHKKIRHDLSHNSFSNYSDKCISYSPYTMVTRVSSWCLII